MSTSRVNLYGSFFITEVKPNIWHIDSRYHRLAWFARPNSVRAFDWSNYAKADGTPSALYEQAFNHWYHRQAVCRKVAFQLSTRLLVDRLGLNELGVPPRRELVFEDHGSSRNPSRK
jgi:hypothetical protein